MAKFANTYPDFEFNSTSCWYPGGKKMWFNLSPVQTSSYSESQMAQPRMAKSFDQAIWPAQGIEAEIPEAPQGLRNWSG
jgi:hypothetical protein